jgi:hypothetical protein
MLPMALAARARQDPELSVAIAAALIARLVFWVVTNRVWEDALITTIHARNALNGLGLIHHLGEAAPVHGFTSVVSVLIPLVADVLVRGSDLMVMPIVSLAAVVVALVYARRLTLLLGLRRWPTLLVLMYLALDQNHIFYGMAGMETEVAVAVLLAGFYYVIRADQVKAGLAIGLGVLVRPDFLIWAVCALIGMALLNRHKAVVAGVLALITLTPWIAFATWYYGSPVPHTIIAKSAAFITYPAPGSGIPDWGIWVWKQFGDHIGTLLRSFEPFFENTFVFGAPVPTIVAETCAMATFLLVGTGLVVGLRRKPLWPLVAFLVLDTIYRVLLLPISYSDWYVPPFTATAILFAALGLERVRSAGSARRTMMPAVGLTLVSGLVAAVVVTLLAGPDFGLVVIAGVVVVHLGLRADRLLAVVLILAFAIHLPFSIELESKVEHGIEEAVRAKVGVWLRDHVRSGEPVIAESAGYFEFYSGVTMYDFPGLTSDISLQAVRSLSPERRDLAGLVDRLRSPWLVLRPYEWDSLTMEYPSIAAIYHVAADIHGLDVSNIVEAHGLLLRTVDRRFLVLRHN